MKTAPISRQPEKPWAPRFEAGQVVRAQALNQLATLVEEMGQFHAQQFFGRGILYGLSARLAPADGEWVLSPGAALDAFGRLIHVAAEVRIPACDFGPEANEPEAEHPHVREPMPPVDGRTPVLFYRAEVTGGQGARSRRLKPSFDIRWVSGRVSVEVPEAYRLRPLPRLDDLRAANGKVYCEQFQSLKDGVCSSVSTEETEPFRGRSLRRLKALELSEQLRYGRPNGRDLLTIAAINDVVYTLWQRARAAEYLRLRGLEPTMSQEALNHLPESVEHGVPLGWLYADGEGGRRWDGRWRVGFALGLSRLEVVGYSPHALREIGAERVGALLKGLESLQPFLDPDRDKETVDRERPHAWVLDPRDYLGGTQAWLRHVRLDRPQRVATFWPLDPLRGSLVAPSADEPRLRGRSVPPSGSPNPSTSRPSPSLIDPLNDPFTFSDYAEADQIDGKRSGLVGLAELIGFPLGRVWGALAAQVSPKGQRLQLSNRPVSIGSAEDCRGLEFVMLASFDEPLVMVTEEGSDKVMGFAHAVTAEARERDETGAPPPPERSFLRWLLGR